MTTDTTTAERNDPSTFERRRETDRALVELERARTEANLLLRLASVTSASERPDDVYEPAFDAARDLFGAERSAILLFDAADRMRFHAWRGLSDAYRTAVDGHSPWVREQRDALPILIHDVSTDGTLAMYRPVFATERIRAIGLVPLIARRELLGKFMLYWDHPRTFSAHDDELALAIASQIAEALERSRLLAMERRSHDAERIARAQAEAAEARMAFLAEASVQLSSSLDYQVTLRKVAELAVPRLADWCVIDLATEQEGALNRVAVVHDDPRKVEIAYEATRRSPLNPEARRGAPHVLRTGRAELYRELPDEVLVETGSDPEAIRLIRSLEIGSVMSAPITTGARTLGVISFATAESGRRYAEPDLQMAEEIGRRAGTAIENARLYEEEKRLRLEAQAAEQRRAAIQLISDVALTHLEIDPLLTEMLARVRRIFLCDTATIFSLDEDRRRVEVRASDGIEPGAWDRVGVPLGSGVLGAIAARGQPIVVEDVGTADVMSPVLKERLRSMAGVPLVVRGEVLGVLHIGCVAPRSFSDSDVELMQWVAARVALALDRANAYDALRVAEGKLRVALSAGRMGVWEWSIQAGHVTWSPTLEAIHGLQPGTFPGTFDAYQSDIHPEDRDDLLRTIRETLETQREHHVEYRIVLPDGHVRWVAGHGDVVALAAGKPLSMMGVCMDITERKHIEQARAAAAAELEQTLHDNEMFAGILAHDLRSPLAAIVTAVQLLTRQPEASDERVQKPLQRVLVSGDRMTRLIDQLLDFTRARVGGGFELQPRRVDLTTLYEMVVSELELAHPDWKLRLDAHGDCAGLWDPDRLLQVVSNLIANAGQHGTPGMDILVSLDGTDRDGVSLAIHNGGSIPGALLPKLFAPFRSAREGRFGGLGLGLFITRQIIVAHGGRIDVASTDASGTTFRVWLPRRAPRADFAV